MLKKAVGAVHSAAIFSRRARAIADGIRPLLPNEAKVLDVGTGDGTIASLWFETRPDLEIEGIDVHPRPITKIPVTLFDGQKLPFPDKSHDVVTFVDVLHHTDNLTQLLSEAARVARQFVVIKDHFAGGQCLNSCQTGLRTGISIMPNRNDENAVCKLGKPFVRMAPIRNIVLLASSGRLIDQKYRIGVRRDRRKAVFLFAAPMSAIHRLSATTVRLLLTTTRRPSGGSSYVSTAASNVALKKRCCAAG